MDKPGNASSVKALVRMALKLDPGQRPHFLLKSCAGQPELLTRVCSELATFSDLGSRASAAKMQILRPDEVVGNRFRIVRFIAQGGMGSVYLAEDLHLGARVALKTVRSDKASEWSPDRLRREVNLARQVTHRNVCRIYDLGIHHDGDSALAGLFITMEFLEGKTLSQCVRESSLSEAEILEIARQVALALAAAHEQNIVHGDLKSSNIILVPTVPGYRAVVTDFGLARIVSSASALGPGDETAIVGTPAYMSPEQLVGERVGPQSDLYSYGVVLFEMATGTLPFDGNLSSRLREDAPRPSGITPGTNPKLEAIIVRCLERDPQNRFKSAAEVLTELERSFASGASPATRRKPQIAMVGAAIVLAIIALTFASSRVPWPFSAPSSQPTFTEVTNQPGQQLFPTLSPDATRVAYSWERNGNSDIYVESVGGGQPIDITPECKSSDSEPAWSPDGQSIAYRCENDGGGISISAADGSWNRRLTAIGHQPSWAPDGTQLVVATERAADLSGLTTALSPLWIVNAKDGSVHRLANGDGFQPSWSPHGHRIAFWAHVGGRRCIKTAAVDAGSVSSDLVSDKYTNWNPVWSSDGHWLYFLSDRGGTMNLWRIAVIEKSGERLGDPKPVTLPATYVQHVSASRDGRSIVYVQRTLVANLFRIPFDSDSERLGTPVQLTSGVRFDSMPDISSDGSTLVFASASGQPDQICVMAATGAGPPRQITDNADESVRFLEPRWSPDGKLIAFQSNLPANGKTLNQIWSIRPDGSDLSQLTRLASHAVSPVWKSDGSQLAYSVVDGRPWLLQIATSHADELAAPPDSSMQFIAKSWSADGRRIAGSLHRPDGSPAGIVVYSLSARHYDTITSFGSAPVWLKDGVRLLFRSGASLYLGDTFRHLSTRLVLPPSLHVSDTFAVSSDNRWLIVSSTTEQANVWVARNMR